MTRIPAPDSADAVTLNRILDRFAGLNLLVCGDVMLDHYLWGDAHRISPEAPVPVVDVARESYTPGGAANVAMNLASLGSRVELAGWVGRDEPGRRLLKILRKSGVGLHRPLFVSNRATIVKTRVIVQHQQLCRLDRELPASTYAFSGEENLRALVERLEGKDAVILSDYAKGLLTYPVGEWIARAARERGIPVALDPKPQHVRGIHNLDILTPNRREALLMAGLTAEPRDPFPAEAVCRAIWQKYKPLHLIITLGEAGMLLSHRGKVVETVPTAAREVYDVSGAGDTVIASLVLAMAAGADLRVAARIANAAAGVVVGKLGTATVSPSELRTALGLA